MISSWLALLPGLRRGGLVSIRLGPHDPLHSIQRPGKATTAQFGGDDTVIAPRLRIAFLDSFRFHVQGCSQLFGGEKLSAQVV